MAECIRGRDPIVILMADDDQDDFMLVRDALEESPYHIDLRWVKDGEEAMEYLGRSGAYREPGSSPRPDLILLDLNMPRKDGFEVLRELKGRPELRKIPVVILTTSREDEHVSKGYSLGANSFLIKPISFEEMVSAMGSLCAFWFTIAELPRKRRHPEQTK